MTQKIFVGGLPETVTNADLRNYFGTTNVKWFVNGILRPRVMRG